MPDEQSAMRHGQDRLERMPAAASATSSRGPTCGTSSACCRRGPSTACSSSLLSTGPGRASSTKSERSSPETRSGSSRSPPRTDPLRPQLAISQGTRFVGRIRKRRPHRIRTSTSPSPPFPQAAQAAPTSVGEPHAERATVSSSLGRGGNRGVARRPVDPDGAHGHRRDREAPTGPA